MKYTFICDKCEKDVALDIPMKEYKSDGNMCPTCGTELRRKPADFCFAFNNTSGGFYQNTNVKG